MKKEEIKDHGLTYNSFCGELDEVIDSLIELRHKYERYKEVFVELIPENNHWDMYVEIVGYREETEEEILERLETTKQRLADKIESAAEVSETSELKELKRLLEKYKDKL